MLEIEKPQGRSSGLDLLRTVLAIYVVFAHAVPWLVTLKSDQNSPTATAISNALNGFAQPNGETNLAVLAFIVLSGYCIHRSGIGLDLRAFAIRRCFRIVPTYLTACIFGFVIFAVASHLYPLVEAAADTTEISLGCALAKMISAAAVFPELSHCAFQGNAPLRTVAAEMWLYAAYPVGLLVLRKYGEPALWKVLFCVAVVGAFLSHAFGHVGWWRNDSFFGFLLYWWLGAKALDRRFWPVFVGILPFAAATWILLAGVEHFAAIELRQLSFALIVAAALPVIDRAWHSISVETFGRAGYSIYAFHAPIVYFAIAIGFSWQLAMIAAVIIGLAAFYGIENPFDKRGRNIAKRNSSRFIAAE